ncbi:MAG: hypothetical protein RSC12_01445 [Alistipes sp.]
MNEKDYTHRGWLALVALIILLLGVSFIPPQSIGGISFRRANILSDLISFADKIEVEKESPLFDEAEYRVDMEAVAEQIEADTLPPVVETRFAWDLSSRTEPADSIAQNRIMPDTTRLLSTLIDIEDFDSTGNGRLKAFYHKLAKHTAPVRIAVLGDSFIEGDILTADLREKLQSAYDGGGVGFVPVSSPLTGFRRTVKTQAKGWTAYNIMQRKAAPQHLRDNFYISGWVCQPTVDASTRWECTDAREHLESVQVARVFFVSPNNSRVEVVVNDSQRREFAIEGDASVRQIVVSADSIHSLIFKVRSGVDGFIGYGALFEDRCGVVVDNYSVRSNNGQAMFWTNPSINAQINAALEYDLVILQYGLNIMQAGVRNYSKYADQVDKMIAYTRQCFPTAAILVLGVSDRAVKTEEGFVSMDAIPSMLSSQRRAAETAGVAFWSTYEAMVAQGGMLQFVANGWAGKDFTHINYAGGRRVAYSLFDAINHGVTEAVKTEHRHSRTHEFENILDTLQRAEMDELFLPVVVRQPTLNP